MSFFQIQPSDLDSPQGEGDIKEDDKGGKNSLEVKKGTRVQLIRLTDNPKGKWLVKLAVTGLGKLRDIHVHCLYYHSFYIDAMCLNIHVHACIKILALFNLITSQALEVPM